MYMAAGCLINDIIVSHVIYLTISRGVYSRAAFSSLRALEGAEFIRGRRLLKGGVQSNKYGIYNKSLNPNSQLHI